MTLRLIAGGARSGKSSFAVEKAKIDANGSIILFIATAEAFDEEMSERIARHKSERNEDFDLIESPRELAKALGEKPEVTNVIVDCLTLWLSNMMLTDQDLDFQSVITAARSRSGTVSFISNEVGEGIVPMHPVSRRYRDLSGLMNQAFAAASDEVFYLRFGIAQRLK